MYSPEQQRSINLVKSVINYKTFQPFYIFKYRTTKNFDNENFLTLILYIIYTTALGQTTFNYQNDFKTILAKSKDSTDKLAYEKLLPRFTKNDTTLSNFEVLALLIGFTAKPAYKPYADLAMESQIYKLNGDNHFQDALTMANNFLKTHPLSVKALFEKSFSFYKLNQQDSADFYLYQGQRIFRAMYFSGNGKSPKTPTFALWPTDGQDYIQKFVGGEIGTMGDGKDKAGNFLDMLEAKFQNGQSIELYFIIQHAAEKMFAK